MGSDSQKLNRPFQKMFELDAWIHPAQSGIIKEM